MASRFEKSAQQLSSTYILAERDIAFLARPELRPVRLQLELLKPELIMREHGVYSTVVVFGSARVPAPENVAEHLAAVEAESKAAPEDKAKLEKGLRKHKGLWMTEDQIKEDEGFVKFEGKWVKKDEVEVLAVIEPVRQDSGLGDALKVKQTEHFAVLGDLDDAEMDALGQQMERLYAEWLRLFPAAKDSSIVAGSSAMTRPKGVQSMRWPPAFGGSRIGVSSAFVAFSTSGGWRARSPVL